MPLRDHFRPPVDLKHSWDELHGMWPAAIVRHLFTRLPAGYVAAPGIHLVSPFEIDVSTYEEDEPLTSSPTGEGNGGIAVAPPNPAASDPHHRNGTSGPGGIRGSYL